MQHTKGNTTNTLLILVLVIIVGFVVWYVTAHKEPEPKGIQINLGSSSEQN